MRTLRRPLVAFLSVTLLLAGCEAPGGSDAGGPAYSVCRAPEPGTNYQVCG